MKNELRKKYITQNRARFLFIGFSLCTFLPMPVASFLFRMPDEPDNIHNPGLLLFIIFFYLVLEIIEYGKFHYTTGRKLLFVFFILRLILWLTLSIFYQFGEAMFLNVILTPLITFYAYFCFPGKISIAFCGLLIFYEVWINFFFNTQEATKFMILSMLILFFFVKVVFILFFQLYARLWERDKENQAANDKLVADLQESHIKLKEYADQIADTVAIEERNRLARDIHDSLGHYLAAINIQLSKAEAFFERDRAESLKALHDAKQAAGEAIEDVRESVQALSEKKHFPFIEAVRKIIDRIDRNTYTVKYTCNGVPDDFNYSVLITLYRVIQEGITNIFKHSKADHISLDIVFGKEEADVRLKDNGIGFTADHPAANMSEKRSGFGLNNLTERLELVQGRLVINSEPGRSTELIVTAPRDPIKILVNNYTYE